jgi:hypothetical protein
VEWKRGKLVLLIASMFVNAAEGQQTKKVVSHEQSSFGIENEVERPVTVPEDVLQLLRSDPLVLRMGCLKENRPPERIQASWFAASQIHLDGANETDLVVQARNTKQANPENLCLFGANIGPFWVYRKAPQGYQLVLGVSALGLEVLKSRAKGYRNIWVGAATATMMSSAIFEFDGQKYRPYKNKLKPLR